MRVFIAEDQFLLRRGLEDLLTAHGIEVAGSEGNAEDIVARVAASEASLALLDIRMPPTNTDEGIRAALALRSASPGFPVVLLSQYVEELYLDELLSDGVGGVGYLLKDRVFDDVQFVTALRTVAAGSTSVDPEVIARLMQRRTVRTRLDRLTPREYEVLSHMAEGASNSLIAERLVVTEKAVAKHINSMFAKLDLPESSSNARRVQAVLEFLRQ
ncbi:response regulator transcription factor [Ammonicoccus fulvus]|uniref:Response regulator transcription factor n=1 Tax=Ammonicoccus fulvus TaxID=3138240 RepID=A0ABZ3FLJ8_9ACTN